MSAGEGMGWVDDLSVEDLLAVLSEHGVDVNAMPPTAGDPRPDPSDGYDIVPMRDGWLRIGVDSVGRMEGRWIVDPTRPDVVDGRLPILFDEAGADDLDGWVRARSDLDGSCRRWITVLRRPEREAYAALIYEPGPDGAVRRQVVAGVYPDITLCDDDASVIAFVEPDRDVRGTTRAVVAPVGDNFDRARMELSRSANGGIGVRPCSVRRFVKLSHGVRTLRVWDVVDVRASRPTLITVPGVPSDPQLFDVALLDGAMVLVQAVNADDHWELVVSLIEDDEILQSWRAATGPGTAVEVSSGDGVALLRVRPAPLVTPTDDQGVRIAETIMRVPLAGFSTRAPTALGSSTGLFSLGLNSVTPAAGFAAVELNGGSEPYVWFWDNTGQVLNDPADRADRAASNSHRRIERVTSDDGYVIDVDLRWRGDPDRFEGPVLLMVYGAYGMDIDLDADHNLGHWLDRGFAVGTPHVRGGGQASRHLAGCRANRDRSLADLRSAVRWLRAGEGVVRASRLAVLGASAGGFLAATTLNTCPDEIDACVIVNGFVDPLTSLVRRDTTTIASDQDEWGNPFDSVNDLQTLEAVSPVANLNTAGGARALVVVAAKDVRVNPRQGLKWFLTYRGLGGEASLWYDPNGAHDCWGLEMDPDAMIDWVCAALGI